MIRSQIASSYKDQRGVADGPGPGAKGHGAEANLYSEAEGAPGSEAEVERLAGGGEEGGHRKATGEEAVGEEGTAGAVEAEEDEGKGEEAAQAETKGGQPREEE